MDCPSVLQDPNTVEHILDELDRKVNGHRNPSKIFTVANYLSTIMAEHQMTVCKSSESDELDRLNIFETTTDMSTWFSKNYQNYTAYSRLTCTSVLMTYMYLCAHR